MTPKRSTSDGFTRGCLMVIAAVTIAVVVGAVIVLVAVTGTKTSPPTSQASIGGGEVSTPASTTSLPATGADRQELQVTAKGFTQLPPNANGDSWLTYAVVVLNPNPAAAERPWTAGQVSLAVTFIDASGNVLHTENPGIDYVLPGQHMATASDSVKVSNVASMTVDVAVGKWTQNDRPISATFTATGVTLIPGDVRSEVTGTVTSTFASDFKNLALTVIFVTGGGQVTGGATASIASIPRQGTVSFSVQDVNPPPNITHTFVNVSPTALTNLSS